MNGTVWGVGLWRALLVAAIIGISGVLWNASQTLAGVSTTMALLSKQMEKFDERLLYLERRETRP